MKTKQEGVAIVEFALVLPMLLILTFITTEFGRALYQYNILTKSVRDAARYLSSQNPKTKITESKNLIVYGSLTNTGSPLAFGLELNQVKDPVWQLSGSSPIINTVTVKIAGCATSAPPCYKFIPLVSSAFGINFGNINYADISATMRSPL
ncbi:pilus assembly protein TadE [Rhodococcus sp. SRB_17]|uniref:TadE/TadG family type IV pilus assembly protein n=1 Tax=Acidovorax sp. SRB_24 TaxID=1962700 RepID=UPI00145F1BC0|nr:TadE family protein [Acidovorax sp. SRB_24]NMM78730.1 pilus assembly protein TadE [Acidovorax sp. SRB_24]NMM84766.1 pilus assembly protein TadE [Rhodococcus sp. SRB_17]